MLFHSDSILFWDTVQFTSKHGSWFYDYGLLTALPVHLDSGHPPVFGMYQALLWKLFGQSLLVSHLSMLPFVYIIIWFAIKLGGLYTTSTPWLYPAALLLCPFMLGHLILVSPDIVLMAAFLMALHSILAYRHVPLIISSVVLAMISMRGFAMMGGLAIFLAFVLWKKGERVKPLFIKLLRIYFFPVALFAAYQSWHMMTQDWVGYHEASPWSASFAKVSMKGILKNVMVFGWRIVDYGMVVPVLFLLVHGLKSIVQGDGLDKLFRLLIILIGILFLLIIPFSGLMNHRYFLPIVTVILLLTCKIIGQWEGTKRTIGIIAIIGSMVAGNMIVYPDTVAQGWDSTAAHWPIYGLYKEMSAYINDNPQLAKTQIGTAFPFRVSEHFLELNNREIGFHNYDMHKDQYILRSNIMNDFPNYEIAKLDNWTVLKTFKKNGVHLTLYQRTP